MPKNYHPKILIITDDAVVPGIISKTKRVYMTNVDYVNIVNKFGVIPILVPSLKFSIKDIVRIMSDIDGVFLTGGRDISPAVYGKKQTIKYSKKKLSNNKNPISIPPNIKRDKLEIAIYKNAILKNIPVLGVCRGMQLINVAEGGTLIQELQTNIKHYNKKNKSPNTHKINIKEKSLAHRLLKAIQYSASSIHHQGIDKVGKNIIVSAKSQDGIAEIIEYKNNTRFVIGIQGHPEITMLKLKRYDNIFREFILRSIKPS